MLYIIYKVYVNLCYLRVGSCDSGTKAAHLHAIGMIHAKYLCIWIWSTSSSSNF